MCNIGQSKQVSKNLDIELRARLDGVNNPSLGNMCREYKKDIRINMSHMYIRLNNRRSEKKNAAFFLPGSEWPRRLGPQGKCCLNICQVFHFYIYIIQIFVIVGQHYFTFVLQSKVVCSLFSLSRHNTLDIQPVSLCFSFFYNFIILKIY